MPAGTFRTLSPWLTLVFVIPKPSGLWGLLQELRTVNAH